MKTPQLKTATDIELLFLSKSNNYACSLSQTKHGKKRCFSRDKTKGICLSNKRAVSISRPTNIKRNSSKKSYYSTKSRLDIFRINLI